MTEEKLDYKKIGLKCGVEIHQQLNTRKLFCDCPSLLRDDKPDIEIKRKLRAVIGETGEIDIAAKAEMEKHQHFIYQAYSDTTCLVELDEEPPHSMNKEALQAALQSSLLMNATPVDEVQIMRKTVVNGSNTTGFQRTALVARNGIIKTKDGDVTVPTISIEEDSAKDIERHKDYTVYRLDRLGIPLIEIGTGPDIKTPEQFKEVAAHIGMVLRSTGKAKRGLGTIRQDVNVSIAEGARIEIKGAQDLKMIPTLVEYEARRQIGIVEVKKEVEKRKLDSDYTNNFLTAYRITDTFKNTACAFVNKAITKGDDVVAFKLKGFAGLLGKELQPGRRLGSEFSDYAKVKTGIGGIIHSDEKLDKYHFSNKEILEVKKRLDVKKQDAFVLIVTDFNRAERAVKEVCVRASRCGEGVICEVRKALEDGTSSYMRPMPGAARLYPETDTMPIRTDVSKITLPELLSKKSERFIKEYKLGTDLANLLVRYGPFDLFEKFVARFKNIKPSFLAETIMSTPKTVSKKIKKECEPTNKQFEEIFTQLNEGKIGKDALFDIFSDIANNKFDLSKFELMSDSNIEEILKEVVASNKGVPFNAVIGQAMAKLKGKADGRKVMEMLKKLV